MAKVLMKGNEALSEAAIKAGCTAFFGYPITPQNEIPEYLSARMEEEGLTFVQAESEVAAINMVYGASAGGARVMTSSSSPGIALKQEGISYLAGARLPCFIVSITRAGPGLGGILPAQSDYFQAVKGGGNGDYFTPVYAPNSVQEATDLVFKAFNVADEYRTPVLMIVDGMLGQMMEPVELKPLPRVKVDKNLYITDGNADKRPRNVINSLNLSGLGLEEMNHERFKDYAKIKEKEVMSEYDVPKDAEIVFCAYGVPSRIAKNAISLLKKEGISAGLIRPITLWPFPEKDFQKLPKTVKAVLVTELSMGQMIEDVRLALEGKIPAFHYGRVGGVVFEPDELAEEAKKILKKGGKK